MADQKLQEIKDKVDIVDLVGSYVQLKKAGTNFKGLCPFHHEKSGSFMVSPAKQIFHCFGCGEGGDIFEFVKKIENVEFREALKILADRAGVELPEYKKRDKDVVDREETLYRINSFAAQYYHKNLLGSSGKPALEYLLGRGLLSETIEKWQIGWAPEDFHALENVLLKKSVRVLDLIDAGVSVKNSTGKVFDRFRNRITFPILDYAGKCVGFTARVLKDEPDTAKYINSPETPIYNKSKVLFGLSLAKLEVRKKGYALVVEGQMDCIVAHQAGFTNVVATSGTALTSEHLQLLKRLSTNIIFCFDNDEAGQKAQRRAIELALPLGFSVKVMKLVGAKDPGELIPKGKELFSKAIKDSVWAIDFYMEKAQIEYSPNSLEQKKYVSGEILPLISLLTDRVEQEHYLGKVAEIFNLSGQTVSGLVLKKEQASEVPAEVVQKSSFSDIAEKELVGAVIELPQFRQQILAEIDPESFSEPTAKQFFSLLQSGEGESELFKTMLQSPFAKEASFMVELRLQERQQNKEAVTNELLRSFYLLRFNALKKKLQELAVSMKTAELSKNTTLLLTLTQEYQQLLLKRKKFEQFL